MDNTEKKILTSSVARVDMCGYGRTVGRFSDAIEEGVEALDKKIEKFIDKALVEVDIDNRNLERRSIGDGEDIFFNSVSDAHKFAIRLHALAYEANKKIKKKRGNISGFFWAFKISISYGYIFIRESSKRASNYSGIQFTDVARLDRRCRPGEIMITADGLGLLSDVEKSAYGDTKHIKGKKGERPRRVHRCMCPRLIPLSAQLDELIVEYRSFFVALISVFLAASALLNFYVYSEKIELVGKPALKAASPKIELENFNDAFWKRLDTHSIHNGQPDIKNLVKICFVYVNSLKFSYGINDRIVRQAMVSFEVFLRNVERAGDSPCRPSDILNSFNDSNIYLDREWEIIQARLLECIKESE